MTPPATDAPRTVPAVLVVDDDARGIQAAEVALEGLDIEVVAASDAESALRELLRREFALVVLDVRLGTTDGFTIAREIRLSPRMRELPIIFVTGTSQDPQDVLRGYEVGAADYVSKPYAAAILRAKVKVFADLYRRTAEVQAQAHRLQQLEREAGEHRLVEARREWETLALRGQIEAQRELDRRKDEFIALLAHELRNPLMPITTGLALISRETGGMDTVTKACVAMRRQLDHLVRLVDDLLEVSRISEGKIDLRRERADVRACVEQAAETMRDAIERAAQDLTIDLPETPLVCDVDRARVTQILTNLLANATRYTPRGGAIRVAAGVEGDHVVLRVSDNGVGIPPERIDRVFEKFEQAHVGGSGLGVGLTLVKQLAELHGGTAHAHSAGSGKGSEFEVRLPVVAGAASEAPVPRPPGSQDLTRLRILVIDDEPDIREMTRLLLDKCGHEVHTADCGERGIAATLSLRPDVVLLDIGLPDLNGYQVARSIRAELDAECPRLVAVTGYGQARDVARSVEAGFDEHMVKPVQGEALLAVLKRAALRSR